MKSLWILQFYHNLMQNMAQHGAWLCPVLSQAWSPPQICGPWWKWSAPKCRRSWPRRAQTLGKFAKAKFTAERLIAKLKYTYYIYIYMYNMYMIIYTSHLIYNIGISSVYIYIYVCVYVYVYVYVYMYMYMYICICIYAFDTHRIICHNTGIGRRLRASGGCFSTAKHILGMMWYGS